MVNTKGNLHFFKAKNTFLIKTYILQNYNNDTFKKIKISTTFFNTFSKKNIL